MATDGTPPPPSAPSVSWLHAYPPLPILASSAMAQPAGRLLGVTAVNSVWLRASPLLCALDALAVVVRGCVYCVALKATPQQAVVLLGTDRFETSTETAMSALPTSEDDPNAHERGTTTRIAAMARFATATAIRLAGFGIGIVPLVELIWFEPGGGDAKWTAAWAWMFVGSYIILEIVAQVYRWEQAQPQYTAADFELDEVAETREEELTAGRGTQEGVPYDNASAYAESEATLNEETNADNDDHGDNDADTAGLLATATTPTTGTQSTPNTASPPTRDVEANKVHPYEYNNDPSAHPRLPSVNAFLARLDTSCLTLGCVAHAVFLYWAFLDLVQPPINAHILAVDIHKGDGWSIATSWATPMYYISFPFIFLSLFLDLFLSLGTGFIGLGILVGLGNLAIHILPESTKACGGGAVPTAITVITYGSGGLCVLVSFFAASPFFAEYLMGPHAQWIYEMLSLEFVLLLMFVGACFVFYATVKAAAAAFNGRWKDDIGPNGEVRAENNSAFVRHILQYTGEDSVALFFVLLLTLLLTTVWYAVRFDGSAHWAQHWRDALVANVTSNRTVNGNSTMANSTLANATTSMAAAVASATPVQLF